MSAGQGLVVKPFEPAIAFNYTIIYPATRSKSRLAIEFSELLRERLQALSAGTGGLFACD